MARATQTVTTSTRRQYIIEAGDKFYAQRLAGAGYQISNLRRFRDLVRAPRHILDIGANIGTNTVEYASWAQRVTSFEPTPHLFEWLQQNVAYNQQQYSPEHSWYKGATLQLTAKITLHKLAVGDGCYATEIVNHERNGGQNHLQPTGKWIRKNGQRTWVPGDVDSKANNLRIPVQVVSIDSMNLTEVDGIKIDVEGWELMVLKGAEQTIMRDRPIIQTEIIPHQCARAGYTAQDLCDWLQSRGYIRTMRDGSIQPAEYTKIFGMCDAFWIPQERMGTV